MARLTGFIALFVAALLVADAYAHRTVTTVEVDEENQRSWDRCRQMRGREELRSCKRYLRQSRDVLSMRGMEDNPRRRGGGEMFDECCRELRNVDEQCRCEMLEDIAREEQGGSRGQQGRTMQEKARDLPSMCGLPPQRCHF